MGVGFARKLGIDWVCGQKALSGTTDKRKKVQKASDSYAKVSASPQIYTNECDYNLGLS
jgi:hypothetical protein